MVNISKNKLPDEILEKIYNLFFYLLKKGNNKEDFFIIINEFFTPKEKILFAKRVAIIYLLLKGISQKNTKKILNVSKETVSKYYLFLTNKKLKLIKIFKNKIFKEKFIKKIDNIFSDFFIQPGFKIGHWQLYWEKKKNQYREKNYGI